VRFADILRFAFGALGQQKVRTLLTTLGVILGTFVLVASLAIGLGVRNKVMSLFQRNDQLRRIEVTPGVEEEEISESELPSEDLVTEEKRERIRDALMRLRNFSGQRKVKTPLTREALAEVASLDHVVRVVAPVGLPGRIHFDTRSEDIVTFSLPPDNRRMRDRLIAGDGFQSADERSVILNEFLLYRWEIFTDADVAAVVGKKVRLDYHGWGMRRQNLLLTLLGGSGVNPDVTQEDVLDKAAKQIPAAIEKMELTDSERAALRRLLATPKKTPAVHPDVTISEEFTVAGVVRWPMKDERQPGWFSWDEQSLYADVLLPIETAQEMAFRLPGTQANGLTSATVTVVDEEHVDATAERIKEMGFRPFALTEIARQVHLNLLLISLATAFVAVIALLVAAIGIINTMLMTVLERTHEIGIMKAVGARDVHVQLMFLVEGSLIGLVGGLLGLLVAWLVSFPGDAVARAIVEKQTHQPLKESLFAFPTFLVTGIVVFATLVATLAAVYPARKAARVNPVTALRHE
jgi:putative ABC transport system permease protein